VLAALTYAGTIQLWHIYLLTAIQATAQAFDGPARQSIVPNLVPARDLPNAFSMTSIASQAGAIVGPGLSGFVIAFWGQGAAYLINAISFGAVLLALVAIGSIPQLVLGLGRSAVSWQVIKEGLRFIWNRPIIFSTMIVDFFATFFASANTLMPIVAVDILHVGEVEYGFLSAAQSIGAVFAAVFISQLPSVRRQGPRFIAAVMAFGLATILFGLSRNLYLSIASLVVVGAADSISTIIRNTIRQLATPDNMRGRMVSINQIFFMGGPQLGEVEAGAVAQVFGAPFAVVSGGIGTILAVALIVRRWPQLRSYTGEDALPA
jgi:MFS family permease